MLLYQETWMTPRPEGCPQPQASIRLSFSLQMWTNVSTDPESVKAAASASTPRAATPASAHPAWSSTQRTQGVAQVETPGRKGEVGLELGKELRWFRDPKQEGDKTQVPVTQGSARAPPKGHLEWSHHRPGRQQSLPGLGFLCGVPHPNEHPRPHPFLICHTGSEGSVTSGFQKRNLSPGLKRM